MFRNEPIAVTAKRERAESELALMATNKEFNAIIATDMANIGKCEVVEVLIKALKVKVGDHSFQEAEIKVRKMNILRKAYLVVLKALNRVDLKEIPFKETICCGLVIIITFRVIVFK